MLLLDYSLCSSDDGKWPGSKVRGTVLPPKLIYMPSLQRDNGTVESHGRILLMITVYLAHWTFGQGCVQIMLNAYSL